VADAGSSPAARIRWRICPAYVRVAAGAILLGGGVVATVAAGGGRGELLLEPVHLGLLRGGATEPVAEAREVAALAEGRKGTRLA
jgi:hypothetical protein